MPTNTFNLGKDCTLVLIPPGIGVAPLTLSIVEGFEAKQAVHSLRIRPLNGPPQGADLPDGWNGTFTIERGNQAADDFFSQMEQDFWAGGVFGVGQVFQYVQEVDGSQSVFRFNNVTMHLSDAGSYKADSSVKQTIAFFASTRTSA